MTEGLLLFKIKKKKKKEKERNQVAFVLYFGNFLYKVIYEKLDTESSYNQSL
jgi:hypothetical protein